MDVECTICENIITYPEGEIETEDIDTFVCDDCIEDEEYDEEDDEY